MLHGVGAAGAEAPPPRDVVVEVPGVGATQGAGGGGVGSGRVAGQGTWWRGPLGAH